MKFLIMGDTHIPGRAEALPEWVEKVVEERKYDAVLFTGDATEYSVIHYLERHAKTYAVRGNADFIELPGSQIIDAEGHRIFLFHSTEVRPRGDPERLRDYGKATGADIVVFGHTHKRRAYVRDGMIFINPGTATGVWGGNTTGEPESVAFLELKRAEATVRIVKDGEEETTLSATWKDGWR